MVPRGQLGAQVLVGHSGVVDEEQGIYRGEVTTMMLALADIGVDVRTILSYIEGDDNEEEEEDFPNA
jgi:hypothetical protein